MKLRKFSKFLYGFKIFSSVFLRFSKKVILWHVNGANLLEMFRRLLAEYWLLSQFSEKFVTGCQGIATLLMVWYWQLIGEKDFPEGF
jgi:hypothetical protein